MKIHNLFILITCILCSTLAYSVQLTSGNQHFSFPPKQTRVIANPNSKMVDARCSFITTGDVELHISMKKKSARGNGFTFNEGDTTTITVRNNYQLHISAESKAMIQIVNNGKTPVVANCVI